MYTKLKVLVDVMLPKHADPLLSSLWLAVKSISDHTLACQDQAGRFRYASLLKQDHLHVVDGTPIGQRLPVEFALHFAFTSLTGCYPHGNR